MCPTGSEKTYLFNTVDEFIETLVGKSFENRNGLEEVNILRLSHHPTLHHDRLEGLAFDGPETTWCGS
jgi:hypothetical protein